MRPLRGARPPTGRLPGAECPTAVPVPSPAEEGLATGGAGRRTRPSGRTPCASLPGGKLIEPSEADRGPPASSPTGFLAPSARPFAPRILGGVPGRSGDTTGRDGAGQSPSRGGQRCGRCSLRRLVGRAHPGSGRPVRRGLRLVSHVPPRLGSSGPSADGSRAPMDGPGPIARDGVSVEQPWPVPAGRSNLARCLRSRPAPCHHPARAMPRSRRALDDDRRSDPGAAPSEPAQKRWPRRRRHPRRAPPLGRPVGCNGNVEAGEQLPDVPHGPSDTEDPVSRGTRRRAPSGARSPSGVVGDLGEGLGRFDLQRQLEQEPFLAHAGREVDPHR